MEHEFSSYRRLLGQSIPLYLSQIKRLKAEYGREDPGSCLSDRAWVQRLLVRASLSKRLKGRLFLQCRWPVCVERD